MKQLKVEFVTEAADPIVGNEDAIAVRPGLVIVADGVTPIDRSEPPCIHGVRWFASNLAERIADAAEDRELSLQDGLALAIEETRLAHGGSCDLSHVDAPAATISAVRQKTKEWEYLVLADAAVVLSGAGLLEVVVDDRPALTGRRLSAEGKRPPARIFRATWANQPGGYWVAASDPSVVEEALTGSIEQEKVNLIVVASDGATRLVDTFHRYDWKEALQAIEHYGTQAWIDETRKAEREAPDDFRGKRHDDATIAFIH